MLILEVCTRVWAILPGSRRRQLVVLWLVLTVVALGQLSGIASWYPFVKVLMNRDAIQSTPWLRTAYQALGFEEPRSFLLFLGATVGITLILSTGLRLLADWLSCRFSWSEQVRMGELALRRYLYSPHGELMEKHSSRMVRAVVGGIPWLVDGCILNVCRIYTAGVLTLVVIASVVALDPRVALASALFMGLVFTLVYRVVRARAQQFAEEREVEADAVARCVVDALCAVKEARCPPHRGDPGADFRAHQLRLNELMLSQRLLLSLPGPLTAATAQIGALLVGLYFLMSGMPEFRALVAVYAVALVRIAPEVGALYDGLTKLRIHKPALDRLGPLLQPPFPETPKRPEKLPLTRSLRVEHVTFSYRAEGPRVLRDITLAIPRSGSLALVGATGAGKTTLADLLAGVLVPDSGAILVDDQVLEGPRRDAWRSAVGYVPQQAYLTDDTIRRNIAFGVAEERIDDERVRRAAAAASIDVFIEGLEAGYQTALGERGVSVSGGQRQRIGIARALYREPEVLLLDEATSALDTVTEQSIMKTLAGISRGRTVVVIAHRLSTVVDCDRICFLEHGQVVAVGTYRDLLEGCAPFRALVESSAADDLGRDQDEPVAAP